MKTVSSLAFIREKIYQIRSALMYSLSNELVKMPNNIVTILRMDEDGQLWFLCRRPQYAIDQVEQSFPARLVFYRKGISFFLEVSGKATIVNDENGFIPRQEADFNTEKPVLVRMNMKNLEYTGFEEKKRKTRFDGWMENSYKWLTHTLAFPRHEKTVLQKLPASHGYNVLN